MENDFPFSIVDLSSGIGSEPNRGQAFDSSIPGLSAGAATA
jgi:hypothetical protein